MKRLLVFGSVVVLTLVAAGLLRAQDNPFVGTWKLNPAKSKFSSGMGVKEGTMTIQMVGDQDQITVNETLANGAPFSRKYEVPDKGGAETIPAGNVQYVASGKRINENTVETSVIKGGKEIEHTRSVVAKDGRTMTITNKGWDAQAKPYSLVTVWEKQ